MADKRLGRYLPRAELARWGATVLHEATDEHLQREVLVLRAPGVEAETVAAGRVLARLAHHGLPALLDLREEQGHPFLVLERPEGRRLSDNLELAGPLAPAPAVDAVRQVLEALAYAHGQGAYHGSLDPSYAVLSATGRIALLGVSRDLPVDPTERADRVRDDVRAAAGLLCAAIGVRPALLPASTSLPPRLVEALTRALRGDLPDAGAFLAELAHPGLLARPRAGAPVEAGAVEEPSPSRAALIALGTGSALALVAALLALVSLGILSAAASGAAIVAGERRRGAVGVAVGLLAALGAWWAGGRM